MRIMLVIVVVFTGLAMSVSAQIQAPSAPVCAGTVVECQQKQIIEQRQEILRLQIQLMQLELNAQWATLEHDVRVRLQLTDDDEIDLATLTIKPKPAPAESDAGPKTPATKEKE